MSTNNYEIVLNTLDAFINKYYKNLIIKGILYLLLILLSLFIVLAISEYFLHFSVSVRTTLFYIYLLVLIAFLFRFIIIPILALLRISKHLNYEQASKIIGQHFPEIQDKLSNILQLHQLENVNQEQLLLIEAGINQKAEKIKPFPILKVIDFKSNIKYLKYLLIPVFIILITWVLQPHFVEEPTLRLVKYSQEFEQEQAFSIQILNEKLQAFQKDDFEVLVEISGQELPDKLFINYQNSRYLLKRNSGNHFSYVFKSLRNSVDFVITDENDFKSNIYSLLVFPKAGFSSFKVEIFPPKYTNLPSRKEMNIGDIKVPEGSRLQWIVHTNDCDDLILLKNKLPFSVEKNNKVFVIKDTILKTSDYKIYASNSYLSKSDSISWMVHMIRDEYPQIGVESLADSNDSKLLYFNGYIDDDYGFSNLQMIIEKGEEKIVQNIPFDLKTKPQRFYHYLDLNELDLEKGSDISYYFQVSDNDQRNGFKKTKSIKQFFHFDSQEELLEKRDSQSDSLKTDMKESLKALNDLHQEIKDFKKELVNKEMLSWEDKQKMENLLKEQEKLQKKIDEFKKDQKQLSEQSQDINQNERILDKQHELQELFEQVMDEETKKKMDEIRKMLDEMNKENAQELLEKMEMTAEELEDQLDRNLELFKQLEFEMKLEESISELNKLAEKQEELSKETKESKKEESDDLKQKQDSINQAFDDIKKDLAKLDSLNKSLEEPNKFDQKEEDQQKVDSLQQEAKESLDKKKMDKASEQQQKASEKMKKMASDMQMQMDQNAEEQAGEDMEALREILDQLIKLSFIQESYMDSLLSMEDVDPRYNDLVRSQFKMESKFQTVRDSLSALAKRQPMIQPFIIKEFNKLDYRLKSTTDYLEEHKRNEAVQEQQYIMTSFNQLALMLSEALQQMQEMMQNMMEGKSGSCSKSTPKPGNGKPSPGSMKQMQQQLNEQMKALEKQKKEGKEKGKEGNQGMGMSEQFARMAAEQAKIRRMMEEYQQQLLNENGTSPSDLDAMMKDMEKTEKDLVNKIINQETLKRQQNIMTRLLKSEKAEREREKEQERKSEEGKNVKRSNPKEFLKYKDIKEKELNLMKTIPLDFNSYYKKKVDEYFYKFDNIDDDAKK